MLIVLFLIVFTACNRDEIKSKSVTESKFNLVEAKDILRETYKSINVMTNNELETKPEIKVKSYEEFMDTFDFSLFDESVKRSYIFETIVDFGNDGNPVKDEDGFLVYGEGNIISYIPSIFDKGVVIEKAFIRDVDYGTKYSSMNFQELVIIETRDESIDLMASGFNRINRFKMNTDGKWILYAVEGTTSFVWER
jgi:hypothetical protein